MDFLRTGGGRQEYCFTPRSKSPKVFFFFKVFVRTKTNYDPDPSQKIIGGGHPSFFEIFDGIREKGGKLTFYVNFP